MNFEPLEEVLRLLEQSRVAVFELEEEDGRLLRLRRTPTPARPAPVAPAVVTDAAVSEPEAPAFTRVEALFVGRFHLPRQPVNVGDDVEEDQILGAVESLGLMNAVSAPHKGRVEAIHVEDGEPVEYGQLLFEIS